MNEKRKEGLAYCHVYRLTEQAILSMTLVATQESIPGRQMRKPFLRKMQSNDRQDSNPSLFD